LVLEGTLHDGHSLYGEHTFIRNQPGYLQTLSSQTGCVLYLKRRKPIRKTDADRSVIDAKNIEWKPYPARGARVLHLYRDQHGVEAARLVDVYPDKQIPTHDHAMGDETFVVGGVIMDEHGSYGAGVWIRTPIGIPHTPFTKKDNVVMLIRDGDMVW
jgi:anti-sigma factor ChrR (cupin superfamily)